MVTGAASVERPRETILRAATRLFGQRSYQGTTMRDIAGEVGILAGSLYAHISSKEALLLEIIEAGITEFIDQVKAAPGSTPPERLRAMIKAHVAVVSENPDRTLIVFHQWRYLGEESQRQVRQRRRTYEGLFTKVISDGVEAGVFSDALDARTTRLTILGALNWTPEWLSPGGPASVEQLGDRIADVLLSGVERRRPAARRRSTAIE
jgi:TetR/AcrR family transcriptional regulator, cholesterol catabolism regulator